MALISSIEGNRQYLDGGAMFGNAPRAVWQKWLAPDERGRIPLACRALLIEDGPHKILCETGIGVFFDPKLADRFGVQDIDHHRLLENLEALGIREHDIDYVLLSHLHFDHVGGILPKYEQIQKGEDRLLFPNAKYVVGREAWERALHPHPRDKASFIPGLTDKFLASNRLIIVEGDRDERLPHSLSFSISNGHTPGQMHTIFKGQNKTVFFAGDLIPGQAWVHLPITMGYDRFPELLIDEKTQLYERAVPEAWMIFLTHDPHVAACEVSDTMGERFSPGPVYQTLNRYEI